MCVWMCFQFHKKQNQFCWNSILPVLISTAGHWIPVKLVKLQKLMSKFLVYFVESLLAFLTGSKVKFTNPPSITERKKLTKTEYFDRINYGWAIIMIVLICLNNNTKLTENSPVCVSVNKPALYVHMIKETLTPLFHVFLGSGARLQKHFSQNVGKKLNFSSGFI